MKQHAPTLFISFVHFVLGLILVHAIVSIAANLSLMALVTPGGFSGLFSMTEDQLDNIAQLPAILLYCTLIFSAAVSALISSVYVNSKYDVRNPKSIAAISIAMSLGARLLFVAIGFMSVLSVVGHLFTLAIFFLVSILCLKEDR